MKRWLAPLVLLTSSCTSAGPEAPSEPFVPTRAPVELAPPRLVAATLDHRVALLDEGGSLIDATPPQGAPVRDVDWDPVERGVSFVVGDDDETSSEWRLAPLVGSTFGEPWGVASTDGRGRVLVVAEGTVLFENASGGPGWRFLPRDGHPASSVGAPEPRSPALVDADGRVCALAWSKEALSVGCATLGPGGFGGVDELVWAPTFSGPRTARLVSLEPPLVVDRLGGLLTLRDLGTGGLWPTALPFEVDRVDDAITLEGGGVAALVTPVLASGAPPAALVRVDLAHGTTEWLPMVAPAVVADTFYRRALVASGQRLFVALDDRVVAVHAGEELVVDATFEGAGVTGPIGLARTEAER